MIELDRWSTLARRAGVEVRPVDEKLIALFPVGETLTSGQPIEICRAIARGAVDLVLGLKGKRLVATSGSIRLESGEIIPMNGVEACPIPLVHVLQWLHLGELRSFCYAPWV